MTFGEYIKSLRLQKGLSQKQLCDIVKNRVSNAEISRLESGERIKPSVSVLKLLAPALGVSYQELLFKAGYIEENKVNDDTTAVYYDSEGNVVDIVRTAKEIYRTDPDLLTVINRTTGNLKREEISTIKLILEKFADDKLSDIEKQSLRVIIEKFFGNE